MFCHYFTLAHLDYRGEHFYTQLIQDILAGLGHVDDRMRDLILPYHVVQLLARRTALAEYTDVHIIKLARDIKELSQVTSIIRWSLFPMLPHLGLFGRLGEAAYLPGLFFALSLPRAETALNTEKAFAFFS